MPSIEHIESPGYRTVLRNMYPIVKPETWRETVRRHTEEYLRRQSTSFTFHNFATGGKVRY